ncbi:uncharacterized protein LOC128237981 [Mya arenaria]|uniref:uncharacterized protein LOC128237981 n=1 Tax=Mya arenaria TaxID=6604 RepID=UPI0022E048A7|nr:uncharacterized protein LOC128237981 [Mya arenaria]
MEDTKWLGATSTTGGERYVFMNAGGNDIDGQCRPEEIATNIMRLVSELKQRGTERVWVSAIVHRGRFPAHTNMTPTKIRKSVNERLKKALVDDYVDMGKRLTYTRHYDRDLIGSPGQGRWHGRVSWNSPKVIRKNAKGRQAISPHE